MMSPTSPASDELIQKAIDRIWETLPPTWHTVRGQVRRTAVEEFGVTLEQFHVLHHVRRGSATVSEVAEAKQISRSAVSQAVDMLVEKGLLTRVQSLADRRYVALALTPNGDALLNAVFARNRAWMQAKMTCLNAEDAETLLRGLTVLQELFKNA